MPPTCGGRGSCGRRTRPCSMPGRWRGSSSPRSRPRGGRLDAARRDRGRPRRLAVRRRPRPRWPGRADVLGARDELAVAAAVAGLEPPPNLRTAFEAGDPGSGRRGGGGRAGDHRPDRRGRGRPAPRRRRRGSSGSASSARTRSVSCAAARAAFSGRRPQRRPGPGDRRPRGLGRGLRPRRAAPPDDRRLRPRRRPRSSCSSPPGPGGTPAGPAPVTSPRPGD